MQSSGKCNDQNDGVSDELYPSIQRKLFRTLIAALDDVVERGVVRSTAGGLQWRQSAGTYATD